MRTKEKSRIRITSRAGKATSQKWSDSYNIIDLDNGNEKWIDLRNFQDIKHIDGDEIWLDFENEEIHRAKMDELSSWKKKGVYESVQERNQKAITTRWIITEKSENGRRKCKARLVARGFEEQGDLTTDSPTCANESLKMCLAVILKNGWKCKTLDIKTAYLQGKPIERNVYLKPPREAKTNYLWKLKKTVYGLKDAARIWYESIMDIVKSLGGTKSKLEPTIVYWRKNSRIIGIMCIHVDDICYGGNTGFEEKIIRELKRKLEIGKESERKFCYIGLNVNKRNEEIILEQNLS